jgi:hypothetical protein
MSISTMVRHMTAWRMDAELPSDWSECLERTGGGFFHSPPGLLAGAPAGEPIYARYVRGGEVCGVALGVRTSCRLSGRPRHAYFPTWPLFRDESYRRMAQTRMAAQLREQGIAEVRWDSFDQGSTTFSATVPTRREYVVALRTVDDALVWPESAHHRRAVRRGDKEGWVIRELEGAAASIALSQVMELVSERAAERGTPIAPVLPRVITTPGLPSPAWSSGTFAAMDGETLLAAVLLGIGGRRVYYVMGGATGTGYSKGASTWLHAHLITRFAAEGYTHYNMGGVPVSAADPADPSHGLHRFKSGFGATIVPCAGDRWILQAGHQRKHDLIGWAAGLLP